MPTHAKATPAQGSAAAARKAFVAHVLDLMRGLGPVQARPMFGGHGVYLDGLMFGLIADEQLYLKADEVSVEHFTRLGLEPFMVESRGKLVRFTFHQAPPEVYDEPQHMLSWARLAFDAALRVQAHKAAAQSARAYRRSGQGTPRTKLTQVDDVGSAVLPTSAAHSHTGSAASLGDLPNLGPKSCEMLALAGIHTEDDLRALGAVLAYARTRALCPKASLNLLWALEGALSGRSWQQVAEADRASLLMALEDVQRGGANGGA